MFYRDECRDHNFTDEKKPPVGVGSSTSGIRLSRTFGSCSRGGGIMFRCDYLSQVLVINVVGCEAADESGDKRDEYCSNH